MPGEILEYLLYLMITEYLVSIISWKASIRVTLFNQNDVTLYTVFNIRDTDGIETFITV